MVSSPPGRRLYFEDMTKKTSLPLFLVLVEKFWPFIFVISEISFAVIDLSARDGEEGEQMRGNRGGERVGLRHDQPHRRGAKRGGVRR